MQRSIPAGRAGASRPHRQLHSATQPRSLQKRHQLPLQPRPYGKSSDRTSVVVWTAVPSGGEEGQAKEVTQPSADASASIAGASVDGKILAAADVEHEDDLSPLQSALDKADRRLQDAVYQRESLETEAQDVCEIAINAREHLNDSRSQLDSVQKEARRRQDQLAKMEAQRELSLNELRRLKVDLEEAVSTQDVSSLNAVQDGPDVDPAQGDWDISALRGAQEQELSEEEDAISQRRAALLIIEARSAACQQELDDLLAQAADLTTRVAAAEAAYTSADAIASAAMAAAEAAVRDELETSAVCNQVKTAMANAMASLKALDTPPASAKTAAASASLDAAAAVVSKPASETTPSFTDQTKADLDEIVASAADSDDDIGPDAEAAMAAAARAEKRRALLPYFALAAGLMAVFFLTPLGPWLSAEFEVVSVAAQKVSGVASAVMDKIPWPQPHHGEEGLYVTIAILMTSVIAVPLVMKLIPGGSAVLGFLIGGAIIGPHGLAVVQDVEGVRHLAEMGVVFLLFNIGLELSLDRLQAMAKAVFGMGSMQFVLSTLVIAGVSTFFGGYSGPASIILGGALALSSTAVAMQVLQERQETGSRHGRATFAVLLLQDLGVVVLLMLVPLLGNGNAGGLALIAKALALAAIKAIICITGIILGGRLLLRPLFRRVAALENAEIFAATTLLVILGTSVMTQIAGLSLALGAFLAGLLMAETEYALQVESDIAPFKGLLMGLFFISVGMEISVGVLIQHAPVIFGSLLAMLVGKTAIMAAIGPLFGVSRLSAVRSGLYLAPGGEFAFVVLNEAVGVGLMPASHIPILFIMVVLSMALTPYLAAVGSHVGKMLETTDVGALQPSETETSELSNHVIIMGFGRVGQTIAQLLSERLIPFVAVDVRVERVQAGRAADLPVYFGDAGSPAVLHQVGAERARCAVITLDTPGANYRAVWAMNKNFPNAKIYVRAHDIEHGLNLEKAGATAVVPEILEPSLQLAAAVLGSMQMKPDEISDAIDNFRRAHMADLRLLSHDSGGSLGYGYNPDGATVRASATAAAAASSDDGEKAIPSDAIPV